MISQSRVIRQLQIEKKWLVGEPNNDQFIKGFMYAMNRAMEVVKKVAAEAKAKDRRMETH